MFRIKICGVTTLEDARHAVDAGADAIGLNFYSGSKRYVTPENAVAIARGIFCSVGVFVNDSAESINHIAAKVGLDWIQLHGDEPAELLADIQPELPIIRARTLDEHGLAGVASDIAACRKHGRAPSAVLIDATVPGQYGGTGKTVDWAALANYYGELSGMPLILAGGLTSANVADAIAAVSPTAVDTASGVESAPGVKDPEMLQSFIQAARQAFDALELDFS